MVQLWSECRPGDQESRGHKLQLEFESKGKRRQMSQLKDSQSDSEKEVFYSGLQQIG